MELTTCNLAQRNGQHQTGDHLDFTTPRTMRVSNADVYEDWTISVRRDEAKITSFKINDLYTGIIDEGAKTISVYVPEALNLASLVPTFTLSDNATASIVSGVATSFAKPVQITVTNNTATTTYTVTVTKIGKPEVVFVGLASSMDQLNIEELTACRWMLANVPNSLYVSFADIKNKTIDLSACKVIWWHYHKDGGVDGKEAFEKSCTCCSRGVCSPARLLQRRRFVPLYALCHQHAGLHRCDEERRRAQ